MAKPRCKSRAGRPGVSCTDNYSASTMIEFPNHSRSRGLPCDLGDTTALLRHRFHKRRYADFARPARSDINFPRMAKAASVGIGDFALALAGLAFRGVDFLARLHWQHHRSEAPSIASRAGMLIDLRIMSNLSGRRRWWPLSGQACGVALGTNRTGRAGLAESVE